MAPNPHDALFKAAFQNPAYEAAELRAMMPAALARRIDWTTLTLQPGSFVDPTLGDRHSDILFSVRIGAEDAFIYLLFEHQSKVDRFLVLRMLGYVVRIWERYRRQFRRATHLPPVLPLVLHHSKRGWRAPSRLSELFRPSLGDLPELRGVVADMALWVDDISALSDRALRARALAPFPAIALAALRDARRPGRVLPSLHAWADALRATSRAPDGLRALEQLFRYIALVAKDLELPELQRAVAELLPNAEIEMMTIAEKLQREGFKQGIKQGLDKGIKQGRREGLREGQSRILLKLLALKFGTLDDGVRVRVASANLAALERWSDRVLTASTLDQVFGLSGGKQRRRTKK
jgi:predicted transposase YdaD